MLQLIELPVLPLLASDSDWDNLSELSKLDVRGLGLPIPLLTSY